MNRSKAQKIEQLNAGANADVHNSLTVCVYCGSGHGSKSAYTEAANTLGTQLARQGLKLIYGGGGLGLMGAVARAALLEGGDVTGIMPLFLSEREQQLEQLTELVVVDNMHERKMAMFERSDAFVALPGGIGTLEELVEQLTWAQLGQHKKPVILANIEGFWNPFLQLLEDMRKEAFIRKELEVRVEIVNSADDIVPSLIKLIPSAEQNMRARLDVKSKF